MDEQLKNVPLFANLSEDDLLQLCGLLEQVDVPAGQVLFEEGDIGDIGFLGVLKDFQRQGVGRALVEFAIRFAEL